MSLAFLQTLVSRLDDARNDIFVHFDKKVAAIARVKGGEIGAIYSRR